MRIGFHLFLVCLVFLVCISSSETTDAILYSILIPNGLFVFSVVVLVYWSDHPISFIALKEDHPRKLFKAELCKKSNFTKRQLRRLSFRFQLFLASCLKGFKSQQVEVLVSSTSALQHWLRYSALHRLFKLYFLNCIFKLDFVMDFLNCIF